MKHTLLSLCIVLVIMQPLAFAQEDETITKTFTAYMYGTLHETEREAAVRALLEEQPELNNRTLNGTPILQWTLDNLSIDDHSAGKATQLAELLIEHGAEVDGKDKQGNTFLLHYALFAQTAQLEFLLNHGADVTATDLEDGRTALHRVALLKELNQEERLIKKNLKAAELLLNAGADPNARDARGNTPLHSTAFLGNLQMAKLLISKGADINAVNAECYSVLGLVLLRYEERWANEEEKKALEPVIEFLKDLGAQDIQQWGPDGQNTDCEAEGSRQE